MHGENKTLKNIAQVILDKRSEVEQFLLEAINEVKSNSKKDMLNNTKNTIRSAPTNRLESVRKYSNIEEKKFEELSWDEKEHVLRELFAKVQKGNLKKNQEFIEEVMTFAKN